MSDAPSLSNTRHRGAPPGRKPAPALPYFSDPALKQRLDLLQHLTEYADLLLLVKGPHGVGKTALLHQLLERARDHWMACLVDATPLTTRDQLLGALGNQLGLDLRGIAVDELQPVIEERLAALQRAGRVALLIVDDAHALAAPVLDLILHLFELRGTGGKLVRVLLFAEPALEETLQSPALRSLKQQVTHTVDVPPFSLEQTGEFLGHYLTAIGRAAVPPVPPAVVERAYAESGGLPGVLLALAERLIDAHTATADVRSGARPGWRPRLPRRPRWLLVAGIAVALTLMFQSRINEFVGDAPEQTVRADKPGSVALPIPEPQPRTAPPPAAAVPPVAGRLPGVEEQEPRVPATPQPRAPQAQEAPSPVPDTASAAPPEPVTKVDPAAQAVPPAPASSVKKPPAAPAKPPPPVPAVAAARPALLDHDWLVSRPPGHYTLQLLGVRDEAALLAFVREHRLEQQVAQLQTTYQGGAWHVLLYGEYSDRDAAVAARERLVRKLRGVQPWPRTFASVQEQLSQR